MGVAEGTPSWDNPYLVEVVLCIDTSAGMADHLDRVCSVALEFPAALAQRIEKYYGGRVHRERVHVISFGGSQVHASDFLELPHQQRDLTDAVRALSVDPAATDGPPALDALASAIASPWAESASSVRARSSTTTPTWLKARRVILLWTANAPRPLDPSIHRTVPGQQVGGPRTLEELCDTWHETISRHRRMALCVFAPDVPPWTDIMDDLDWAMHYPSTAGEGLHDFEFLEILAQLT